MRVAASQSRPVADSFLLRFNRDGICVLFGVFSPGGGMDNRGRRGEEFCVPAGLLGLVVLF